MRRRGFGSLGYGAWIDPDGKVHVLRHGEYHNDFAMRLLKGEVSEESKRAAMRTGAGLYETELLRRGWVRQRECAFTTGAEDSGSAMSVAIGAAKHGCERVMVEACTGEGRCKPTTLGRQRVKDFVASFEGMRKRRCK